MTNRLAAILFVDIKDSTRRVSAPDGPQKLAAAMSGIRDLLSGFGGEIFSLAGDGIGAFFPSAAAACRAALAITKWCIESEPGRDGVGVRIGIHSGEFTEIEGGYYGPAIHLAARLEQVAESNAIFVSATVADSVKSEVGLRVTSLGTHLLKGLDRAVEVFVLDGPTSSGISSAYRKKLVLKLQSTSSPARPHIAVLPFIIRAAEDRWRLFAEAFTDELTALLSRFRALAVISSQSARAVGQGDRPIGEIAAELGARFLVTGSIQAESNRMRLLAELIDTGQNTVIWAEGYTRVVEDIFSLQDEMCQQISSALALQIERTELERVRYQQTDSLQAYELLLRGHEFYYRHRREDNLAARRLYRRATELDPTFARAYAFLSKTYNLEWRYRWSKDPQRSIQRALELALMATKADGLEARGHSELGFAYLYRGELAQALRSYERALELNPNDADVIAEYGDALTYGGRPQEALTYFATAKLLNPVVPDWYLWCEGGALFQDRRYAEAVGVLQNMKDPAEASRLLAAAYAYLGDSERAKVWAERVRLKHPQFDVADWATTQPFADKQELAHFVTGLRLAGLG